MLSWIASLGGSVPEPLGWVIVILAIAGFAVGLWRSVAHILSQVEKSYGEWQDNKLAREYSSRSRQQDEETLKRANPLFSFYAKADGFEIRASREVPEGEVRMIELKGKTQIRIHSFNDCELLNGLQHYITNNPTLPGTKQAFDSYPGMRTSLDLHILLYFIQITGIFHDVEKEFVRRLQNAFADPKVETYYEIWEESRQDMKKNNKRADKLDRGVLQAMLYEIGRLGANATG